MNDELTFDQVSDWLKANKDNSELKVLISTIAPPTPISGEEVLRYIETKEGQELIQPLMDKRVTNALETFRKNKFETEVKARVATELLKINPEMTPEQKRISELEETMKRAEEERAKERLQGQIKELAFKESVKPDFIAGINFNTVEEAALYIKRYKQELEEAKLAKANELMAAGYKPMAGSDDIKKKGKVDFAKLSQAELIEMELKGELDQAI